MKFLFTVALLLVALYQINRAHQTVHEVVKVVERQVPVETKVIVEKPVVVEKEVVRQVQVPVERIVEKVVVREVPRIIERQVQPQWFQYRGEWFRAYPRR